MTIREKRRERRGERKKIEGKRASAKKRPVNSSHKDGWKFVQWLSLRLAPAVKQSAGVKEAEKRGKKTRQARVARAESQG